MMSTALTEHLYLREHSDLETVKLEKDVEIVPILPSLAKLVSFPVLARLAGDHLVDVLHVLVYLHLL